MSTITETRTLYWDDKDKRFVYIVWDGERARHHKLDRTIHSKEDAEAFIAEKNLGMAFFKE